MDYILLGKQIRKQRLALGLTQEQLAEAIGVSTSYVGHLERGTRKASIDTLVALANAMNVSADFLLSSNIDTVHQGMLSNQLTQNQRLVLKDILETLQDSLNIWTAPVAETPDED